MTEDNKYVFLISDENELLLILNSQNSEPENPKIGLDAENHIIELYRNADDVFTLQNVDYEIFSLLEQKGSLMVCETGFADNSDDIEIIYAYEAFIAE